VCSHKGHGDAVHAVMKPSGKCVMQGRVRSMYIEYSFYFDRPRKVVYSSVYSLI